MRRYIANDRRIANEVTAANVDAPERATYVVSGTAPTSPTDLEVGCDAGTVVVDGNEVSVTAQTASVSDISGQVTQTAYRYHTLSVDATGTLVVRSSPVGEFDANDPDAEPITQVTEPSHETGEVFIGTAFQVDAAVERVFDGRYVLDGVPNSVITQGEGSGLDADTLRGSDIQTLAGNQLSESGGSINVDEGAGSGLDADTVRGETAEAVAEAVAIGTVQVYTDSQTAPAGGSAELSISDPGIDQYAEIEWSAPNASDTDSNVQYGANHSTFANTGETRQTGLTSGSSSFDVYGADLNDVFIRYNNGSGSGVDIDFTIRVVRRVR